MLFNIAVCDDNKEYGGIVAEIIKIAALNNNIHCNISLYSSGTSLVSAFKENKFDIIFLDMEMPELNGIQTGLQIREISKDPVIFYLTSHKEYAYESYEVKAKNYLLKPVSTSVIEKNLLECIEDKRERLVFLDVQDIKGARHRIPVDEITHIMKKKEDRKLHIYQLDREEVIVAQTLEKIEKELIYNDCMIRASKSCLINMNNVRTISKNTIFFCNETMEEASRRCLSDLVNKFKTERVAVKF
jgi:DNA-binding LytR/AlgR family response regulator